MSILTSLLTPHAARALAAAAIVLLYGFARPPQLSTVEEERLAENFHFVSAVLPGFDEQEGRTIRPVHPELERIAAWISSVGASIALNDLDGDGLSNDVCYVDVRSDQVVVAPVPGTPDRYAPFTLEFESAQYDSATVAPMGCLPGDVNEDGFMDLLVYYWGRTPLIFLQIAVDHAGAYSLTEQRFYPQEIVTGSERWFSNAATFADLDGDGHQDLVVGNYFPDDAQILDVDARNPTYMQHSMSRAFNGGRNRILLWSEKSPGNPSLVQYQEATGVFDDDVAHGWTLALGAADLDGDLLPELYFANDFGPDRLLHNRSEEGQPAFAPLVGAKRFTTPSSKVVGRDSFKGMGVDFGDLNADGLLDIYVSNIAAEYSLEESHLVFVSTGRTEEMQEGAAPYEDQSEALGLSRSGWGWESRLADFNNDGVLEAVQATGFVKGSVNRWPELHELAMGNDELLRFPFVWPHFREGDDLSGEQRNPFFVRAQDGRYYDVAASVGLESIHVSRGIATADVDGDGDLDFAVANQWEPSIFYRSECPNCGAYLGLHLLLPVAVDQTSLEAYPGHPDPETRGRPATGATATVYLPSGKRLLAAVDGGNGHSGARSPDLHFGLGDISADTQLRVDLRWRDVEGVVHGDSLRLSPGWHTVLLANR